MKHFYAAAFLLLLPFPGILAQDLDDQAIIDRVSRAIENSEETQGAQISVTSVNGFVLLTGQALSAEQKQQASVAVAFATNSMRRLINELEVVTEIDDSHEADDRDLQARIMDEITSISPETSVTVHNGTVHLLGQVSRETGNAVATTISKIQGVANIRMSYEFVD